MLQGLRHRIPCCSRCCVGIAPACFVTVPLHARAKQGGEPLSWFPQGHARMRVCVPVAPQARAVGLPPDTPLVQVISEDPATQQQARKGANPLQQAR